MSPHASGVLFTDTRIPAHPGLAGQHGAGGGLWGWGGLQAVKEMHPEVAALGPGVEPGQRVLREWVVLGEAAWAWPAHGSESARGWRVGVP